MAHTLSHVYTKDEIKRNAELIQSIFLKLGTKVKLGHTLEACSIIAGHKNWDTASAVAPSEDREVTIVIGEPGSGKTTFIQNAIDTDENTLVIDYNGEYKRHNQTFDNAHILPLRDANDANLIIKVLPSFSRVVMEEAPLIYSNYPDLFAHVVYSAIATIITAANRRALEVAGVAFNIEPEVYSTVAPQSIAVYEFINPHIGRKEHELLSPYESLLANVNHYPSTAENVVLRRKDNISKILGHLEKSPSDFPLAIIGTVGGGKSTIAKEIASNYRMEHIEYLFVETDIEDTINNIKSTNISTPTFIYLDIDGRTNPKAVKRVIDETANDNIYICIGLLRQDIFDSFYEQINFLGVIHVDRAACTYKKLTRHDGTAPDGFQKTANHASYEKRFNYLVSLSLGVGANLIDAQMAAQWFLENIWVGMSNINNDGNNRITIKNADISSCDGIKTYYMSQAIYTMVNNITPPNRPSIDEKGQYYLSRQGYGETDHGRKHLLELVKNNQLYDEKLLAFLEINKEEYMRVFNSNKKEIKRAFTR